MTVLRRKFYAVMDQSKSPPSRLFINSSIEAKDELDERYEKCYSLLQSLIAEVSETEAHDALNATVCKGAQSHEDVSLGLMIGILTEPKNSARYYRDLTFITRDGLVLVLNHLNQLILEKHSKLQDVVRTQLMWLIREMIRNSVLGGDDLCYNMLRQIAGGDVSPKNIYMAETMLDIFTENRGWVEKIPVLIATVVYTYLRLIVDHGGVAFATLRQREVDFTISLLREKFTECMMIGRDIVRLLQNVARIPEFEKFWRDLLFNPTDISASFTDKKIETWVDDKFTTAETTHGPDLIKTDDNFKSEPIEMIMDGNHTPVINSHDAEFSDDDDDDIPLAKVVRLREMKFKPIKGPKMEQLDLSEYIDQLDDNLKPFITQLQKDSDNESRCEIVEQMMQTILQDDNFDQDTAAVLASCFCALFSSQISQRLFPQEPDEESLEDSIGTPLFVIFRNLCQTPEEDPSRQPILMLLSEICLKLPKIGYHLLYYLKASKVNDDKMSAYRDFCKSLDSKDLETCLLSDLRFCQEDDVQLFCYLVPDIYMQFPNIALGNSELLNLIVSCIDSNQLQDLICLILQGTLVMFRKDSFLSVLNASLEWETFEQYCLWQLIAAHYIPVDYILPILPKLEFSAHAEALTSILLLLKQEKPSAELLRHLMSREIKLQDLFVVSVLKYWSQEHEDKLAELIATQLNKFSISPNKRKSRQQTNKNIQGPSAEQMLSHLDQLRMHCKQASFFNHELIQHALQQIQLSCTEVQKNKFSDLFSLAEEEEDIRAPTPIKLRGGTKAGGYNAKPAVSKSKPVRINSGSSEDTSEDDEILKPKPGKKRKRTNAVDSDSD